MKIEKLVLGKFEKAAHIDTQEVIKEVSTHGLLNPEKWDNPEAGSFDVRDFAKTLSHAIIDLMLKELPEKKQGDYTGFEFTKQLAYNEAIEAMRQKLLKMKEEGC